MKSKFFDSSQAAIEAFSDTVNVVKIISLNLGIEFSPRLG